MTGAIALDVELDRLRQAVERARLLLAASSALGMLESRHLDPYRDKGGDLQDG